MIPFAELDKGSELTVLDNLTGKQVPQGVPLTLGMGETVVVTQALGDTLTLDIGGRLVRIETEDLAKLGVASPGKTDNPTGSSLEDQIWDVLKQSYDPEIPVNIVELGLIYDLRISTLIDGRTHVRIDMTLTAPGCGMGPTIAADAQSRIMTIDSIKEAHVELVWDPPWTQDMISEEGKMKLGLI